VDEAAGPPSALPQLPRPRQGGEAAPDQQVIPAAAVLTGLPYFFSIDGM